MALRQWFTGTACTLAFAAMLGPAHSDSIGSAASVIKATGMAAGPGSEQIAYRTCAMQGGVQRCRRVHFFGPGVYGYRAPRAAIVPAPNAVIVPIGPPVVYGYRNEWRPTNPDDYPTGVGPWWRGMDRLNRGGQQQ